MQFISHNLTGPVQAQPPPLVQFSSRSQGVQLLCLLLQPAKPREEGEDFVPADLEHVAQDKEAHFTTVGHGDNR